MTNCLILGHFGFDEYSSAIVFFIVSANGEADVLINEEDELLCVYFFEWVDFELIDSDNKVIVLSD